ncbi:unnamed protein product [Brassica oleracea var. botrytis]
MIFSILEHILTHISFSVVSIVLLIYFLNLLVNLDEIIGFIDSSDKRIVITFFGITRLLFTRWIYSGHFPLSNLYESLIFFSWAFAIIHIVSYFNNNKKKSFKRNNCAKCYFYSGFCYFRSFKQHASVCHISTSSPVPVVNYARKYDDIRLWRSVMRIITINSSSSHYIWQGRIYFLEK